MRQAATSITPSLEEELHSVRRGARTRAIRSRVVVAVAAVLAAIALAISRPTCATGGARNPRGLLRRWRRLGPCRTPSRSRDVHASDLGLQRVLQFAIGPDGNLYVIDTGQRVSVITPEGEVLRQWGTQGSGPGEFRLGNAMRMAPSRWGRTVRCTCRTPATTVCRCSPPMARSCGSSDHPAGIRPCSSTPSISLWTIRAPSTWPTISRDGVRVRAGRNLPVADRASGAFL